MIARVAAAVAGVALVSAGCSVAAGERAVPEPLGAPSSGAGAQSSESASPAPSPAPSQPPATALPFEASVCGDSIAMSVDETLGGQLAAFNRGDFEAAYALSSRGFQASADFATFVRILVSGYPEVVQSRGYAIDDCRQPGPGVVLVSVEVTGVNDRTVRILYRLVLQDEGWRVDGAGGPEPVDARTV